MGPTADSIVPVDQDAAATERKSSTPPSDKSLWDLQQG